MLLIRTTSWNLQGLGAWNMHEQAITLFIMNKSTLELTHLLSEKTC